MSPTRLFSWLLAAAVLVALCTLFATEASADVDATPAPLSGRKHFQMPKFFDFDWYKSKFGKTYRSMADALLRQKIYLAKVFQVFVSLVSYKHARSTYFLKVNEMSDWTPDETAAIYGPQVLSLPEDAEIHLLPANLDEPRQTADEQTPVAATAEARVADLTDVEKSLEDIVSQANESPAFKAIAEELGATGNSRRKRSLARSPSGKRLLSIEQLAEGDLQAPQPAVQLAETTKVESNNPDYVPPEVSAFGLSADEPAPSLVGSFGDSISDLVSKTRSIVGSYWDQKQLGLGIHLDEEEPEDRVIVDHRNSGCFLQPKRQGSCGSCYIFAVMAVLEYQHCISSGELVDFSEQYVVDCGKDKMQMNGCDGGNHFQVTAFTNLAGLELKKNYPYIAREDSCPYPSDSLLIQMGYLKTNYQKWYQVPDSSVEHHLKKYPLYVGVQTPTDFSAYGGGVHNPRSRCSPDGGHAMVAVGMGIEDGLKYVLMRNSHSIHYGEAGYYKLAFDSFPHCILYWFVPEGIVDKEPLVSRVNWRYDQAVMKNKYKQQMAHLLGEYGAKPSEGISHNEFDRATRNRG